MYHTIKEFENCWESVSTTTAKILNVLTDESLNQAVSDGHRTLGRMAWHIVCTIPEMCEKMGLEFGGFDYESPTRRPPGRFATRISRCRKRSLMPSGWTGTTMF